MSTTKITLTGVQETLLLPLWGRAHETKKDKPLLIDKEAVRIIDQIDYDFSQIERRVNPLSRMAWVARSIYFDQKIADFLTSFPNGTIINIGCGLDTTYERVHNGKATWYELDFPEVIETRKKVVQETSNRIFLPYSVFDPTWYAAVTAKSHVLVMIAGVIYYFQENEIKELVKALSDHFGTVQMIFDYSSIKGVEIANKKVIDDGGMDKSAYLKWGVNDIRAIEAWKCGITVDENMKMFADHRKKYPFPKRLGMWISDALSIMSLAKITIQKNG
ncbi:MAG TPA: class I SAM-dependent methyltransferase [Treponemataceae bacterium]|nr:class I SAM-dependent methyltransferase [Treponemataceae bacterium]